MNNTFEYLSDYYDRFTEDVDYTAWADFFQALFVRLGVKPKLVLDLACGTGSLTRILAERGYEMIGVDASTDMLTQAMHNTIDCDPRPLLLNQRMEELDLYGAVDACICCLDSVNYVTDPNALQQAFRRVFLSLEADGVFVFDANSLHKFREIDGRSYICEAEGVFCAWRVAVEGTSCIYAFDIFEQDGAHWYRMQEEHEERIYTPDELFGMLKQAGFLSIDTFGGFDFSSVTGEEDRIFFVCRK